MDEKLRTFILVVSFFMQIGDHFPMPSNALRMINLDAPQMALEGDTIQLSCSYSLVTPSAASSEHDDKLDTGSNVVGRRSELETVYAVKWYRDESEFFRYLTRDWPHKQSFSVEGLNIDVDQSDNQTVVLRNVSLKTSGLFRCEVSTEAPSFLTKSIERKLLIYHLPSEGPLVEHLNPSPSRQQYFGSQLNFRCRSKESKPAASIDWIINETLNLSAIENLPIDYIGRPLIQLQTRRMVRLPLSQLGDRRTRSISNFAPRLKAVSSGKLVYLVESRPSSQETSSGSVVPQTLGTAYALEDPDAVSTGHLAGNSIALAGDSLHQLLESSISWLNLTVDANLLQYISSASVSPDKSAPPEVTWATRKTVGASANFLASLNQTSRGSAFSKTRGKISTTSGSHQRNGASAVQQGSQLSLRVCCVARVMHLSLSRDVRLHLVNKTRHQIDAEYANLSRAKDSALRQSNSGSRSLGGLTIYAISLSSSVLTFKKTLDVI